jgi:hypothetical protein
VCRVCCVVVYTPSGRCIGAGKTCSLLGKHDMSPIICIDCCARWEAVLAFWLLLRMVHVAVLSAASYGLRFGVNSVRQPVLAVARV